MEKTYNRELRDVNGRDYLPLFLTFVRRRWKWSWEGKRKLLANINVRKRDGFYLYNYNDYGLVARDHPVLVKCRGIVVSKWGKVINYAFDRFFNDFENEKAELDFDNVRVHEKLDGTLISVWWNKTVQNWEITTRGTFYPMETIMNKFQRFDEIFKEQFDNFDLLEKGFTYIFELVTFKNRIVTFYEEEFVTLLGVRNLKNVKELDDSEVDIIANNIGVRRPKSFGLDDLVKCRNYLDTMPDDYEGFVIRDKSGNRLKIKKDTYMALSKIKMLKEDDIFDYVIGKLELDAELLQHDEEVKEKVEEIKTHWEKVQNYLEGIYNKISDQVMIDKLLDKEEARIKAQKDFAKLALEYPFDSYLFARRNGKVGRYKWKWKYLKDWLKTDQEVIDTI